MGYQIQTDFSNIDPNEGGGQQFPTSDSTGWLVEMIASDPKENSAKNGQILACQLRGLDGPVQGKLHDFTINLANPNQQAVDIGMGEMSAIAHVTGHIRVGNTSEWHHKPFRVVIGPELDKATKQPTGRNRITKFLDRNGNGPKDAGKGAMGNGQAGNFGGNQQHNNGGGFQQNNGQQGNGFQQNQNQQGGGFGGNQGQTQQGANGGNGQGYDNSQQQGGGFQQQGNQQGGGFSNGQQGQQNAQGGTPNPGGQFQPNNQQGFDPNAANQQSGQGGGFQQNGQQQGNMGGWNR